MISDEEILIKINKNEKLGNFNIDLEDDPPTIPLTIDKVDYLMEKPFSKIKNRFANFVAIYYFERLIKKKKLIIKSIEGLENFNAVKSGAILTCNHFNPYDNYAVFRSIKKELNKKNLYKVIKEGNYTSMKGLYGFFFRYCNTLPIAENREVMKKFLMSINVLLSRGEKILIYPEQSLWRNYKKPRPLKNGAFNLASKNGVPVIPIFITLSNSSKYKNKFGNPIQEYSIHFLSPIYPNPELPLKENTIMMRDKNYLAWKETYEKVYNLELNYDGENI